MGCDDTTTGIGTALSKGSATIVNFVPLTDWLNAAGVKKVRVRTEMRADTGTCQIAPGYELANDIDAPNAPVQIPATGGSYLLGNGIQYQSTFDDISSSTATRLFIRFGVLVKQDADGAVNGCLASIRVDMQGP